MKEKIIINNFSVIDSVEIDIKKINVLIGPQSTGKSIIAKLVFFFRTIDIDMRASIIKGEDQNLLDERIRERFNLVFPDYLLKQRGFDVCYYYGENFIRISNDKAKDYKSLNVSCSDPIAKKCDKLRRGADQRKQNGDLEHARLPEEFEGAIANDLRSMLYGNPKLFSAFIPAVRSFFANIEENIFSLLTSSIRIDHMSKQFGSSYEYFKDIYASTRPGHFDQDLHRSCIDILGGQYVRRDGISYIKTGDDKMIYLRDSSSGQQEAAPLLVSLMALSQSGDRNYYMFIEEPEAHLFPQSQRLIVEIMAMVHNLLNRHTGFFITTHSPYILTSLNNLIQAENTYNDVMEKFRKGKIHEKEKNQLLSTLDKTVPPSKRLAYQDLSAYVIKDGTCKDIKSKENQLIDENDIDDVSDFTGRVFDTLLDISYP